MTSLAIGRRPTSDERARSKLSKEEWREYTKTVWHIANVSDKDHPAVFPVEIPRRLIKLFSFVGDSVLDPFAGVGTTAKAAIELDRLALAVEQNTDYAARIKNDPATSSATVFEGDARSMPYIGDSSVGLIVTSPPYWNKADYGDSPANLGNVDGYKAFLAEIEPAFEEAFRILEPGRKLAIVTANVNQQTDHGLLTFPLAADFTIMLRDLGFVLINELIWSKDKTGGRWGSAGAQRPIFGSYPYPPNFLFKNVHEYVLVFAKPSADRRTGPKVQTYGSLMTETEQPTKSHLARSGRRNNVKQ